MEGARAPIPCPGLLALALAHCPLKAPSPSCQPLWRRDIEKFFDRKAGTVKAAAVDHKYRWAGAASNGWWHGNAQQGRGGSFAV